MSVIAHSEVARKRLVRLFEFLSEYVRIRHHFPTHVDEQPWRLWLSELPSHPSIRLGFALSAGNGPGDDSARTDSSDSVLTVRRPQLTRPPTLPATLEGWVQPGWEDPLRSGVSVYDNRNVEEGGGEARVVQFRDDEQRVKDFEHWRVLREKWAENERPARRAMKVFEALYELYGRLAREGERLELLVGDGILIWKTPQRVIHHPLLLLPVQLEFDADIPEFRIVDAGGNPELYTAAFRDAPVASYQQLAQIRDELERGGFHPLGLEDTSGFLRRFVQVLSPHGRFIENEERPKESSEPAVVRSPVLFLRQRTQGYARALERILEDLPQRKDLPSFLMRIVGVEPPEVISDPVESPGPSTVEPEGVLFSKPWNKEQLRIADRLDRCGGVLVQGPPGTGKTHTIANLIGHLLAQGKTVLVTAHTSKALRVLRGQITPALRPLCVTVLDNDLESRKQLEEAVYHIVEELSRGEARTLSEEAGRFARQRRQLLNEVNSLRARVLEGVAGEYREIVVAGQTFQPCEAARMVIRDEKEHGWIPGPVQPGDPLPLSLEELSDLYHTNGAVTPEDEREMGVSLPTLDIVPAPDLLTELVRAAAVQVETIHPELWRSAPGVEQSPDVLENLARESWELGKQILEAERWELAALEAGIKGDARVLPWKFLIALGERIEQHASQSYELRIAHRPVLAPGASIPLNRQRESALSLAEEAERRGGAISRLYLLFHLEMQRFVRNTVVTSGHPTRVDHFRALAAEAELGNLREEALARWEDLITRHGGPAPDHLGDEPEHVITQFAPRLLRWLELGDRALRPIREGLERAGFHWEGFRRQQPIDLSPFGELRALGRALSETLPPILEARARSLRKADACARLAEAAACLEAFPERERSSVTQDLFRVLQCWDVESYRASYARLADLHRRQGDLQRRQELLRRLARVAPGWAEAIRSRSGVHGQATLPGDPAAAWRWRQLHDELERRASISLPELQQHLNDRLTTLRAVTAELIRRRAWSAQLRRTTLSQQQALVGWLNTMKRLGAGKTKRAIELRAEAARQLTRARDAVPVWIMPLSRVVEQFDPRTTRFDVAIIDEASQCDALALAAIYLAERVVVVGDHEQVSPEGVGQELERIQAIASEHLHDIPNAVLYDGRRSIYDIARESFGGTIMLVEHFRCVPEIIQFSNLLCYNGRIRPLRESSAVALKPHVVPYRVNGAYADNRTNVREAVELVSLLVAAAHHPAYADKSFGVISLVGEDQARLIDSLVRRYLLGTEYKQRNILCGTAAQFQGDERDVVFLSMVDAPTETPLPLRQDDRFRQRFNVAASRAKEQMWIVYSLDPHNDLKAGDLRRRLIEYALDPDAAARAIVREGARTQSPFEREVLSRLIQAGYRVDAQRPAGYYVIDLVAESRGARVAIECDGDRWHPLERLPDDLERQSVLERMEWKFIRIRGTQFYRDPDQTMAWLIQQLGLYGVEPEGYLSEDNPTAVHSGLVAEVIKEAAQLRREWEADEEGSVAAE